MRNELAQLAFDRMCYEATLQRTMDAAHAGRRRVEGKLRQAAVIDVAPHRVAAHRYLQRARRAGTLGAQDEALAAAVVHDARGNAGRGRVDRIANAGQCGVAAALSEVQAPVAFGACGSG